MHSDTYREKENKHLVKKFIILCEKKKKNANFPFENSKIEQQISKHSTEMLLIRGLFSTLINANRDRKLQPFISLARSKSDLTMME